MSTPFDGSVLDLLRDIEEVDIETRLAEDAPSHRIIIWVMVDDADRVFLRSFRGPTARWYREAVANPDCVLHANGQVIPVRAVAATDDDQVEACSRALVSKYTGQPSLQAMLRPEILSTTMRLEPR